MINRQEKSNDAWPDDGHASMRRLDEVALQIAVRRTYEICKSHGCLSGRAMDAEARKELEWLGVRKRTRHALSLTSAIPSGLSGTW